jgi:riboflavin synthase
MFTGIIENIGTITDIEKTGNNYTFWIESPISHELKIDQSIAHNGICLTVEEVILQKHRVTAIHETIIKTNLQHLQKGALVNLERCMQLNGRLDGHIVQGHVDTIAKCINIIDKTGSWEYQFSINDEFANLMIEKGSITLNGISLTIFDVTKNSFRVAIIPYTYLHTNMQHLQIEDWVNIEFDIIGKYINRIQSSK